VLGRLGATDRYGLEGESEQIRGELRPQLVELGRSAPQPSVKEVDELLAVARRLDERAAGLLTAAAALAMARRGKQEEGSAAAAALRAAQGWRDAALAGARQKLETAESEHWRAVDAARGRVAAARMPGPGERLAGFEGLSLYEHRLETPDGRGPLAGPVGAAAAILPPRSRLMLCI